MALECKVLKITEVVQYDTDEVTETGRKWQITFRFRDTADNKTKDWQQKTINYATEPVGTDTVSTLESTAATDCSNHCNNV